MALILRRRTDEGVNEDRRSWVNGAVPKSSPNVDCVRLFSDGVGAADAQLSSPVSNIATVSRQGCRPDSVTC